MSLFLFFWEHYCSFTLHPYLLCHSLGFRGVFETRHFPKVFWFFSEDFSVETFFYLSCTIGLWRIRINQVVFISQFMSGLRLPRPSCTQERRRLFKRDMNYLLTFSVSRSLSVHLNMFIDPCVFWFPLTYPLLHRHTMELKHNSIVKYYIYIKKAVAVCYLT